MPRTSRHKSHRQSKHSSKEAKDYISDTEEDLKVKERSYTRDEGRASKESSYLGSGENRKLDSSFQSKEGKERKNIIYSGNGNALDDYVSSQRRGEKSEGICSEVDRWTVVRDEKDDSGVMVKNMKGETLVNDSEKGLKSGDSKDASDLKNRSSRRHESAAEKDERIVTSLSKGEEVENRSCSSRGDSKRISEKDSGRREGRGSKETKETERVSDRESKKLPEDKQVFEYRVIGGSVTKKHDLLIKGTDKDRPPKRAKENFELTILDEFHTPELEKEREKRIRKKGEGSGDRDCYRDVRESENMDVSSKEGRYKGERDKSRNHAEKYQDSKEKDRYRDDKYREPAGVDRDSRHRAEKYGDEGERENKRREDRHREVVLLRDDNFGEDKDRDNKRKDDKHSRRASSRYLEDGVRDDRLKDEKYREKNDRHKDEKSREDYQRDREPRNDFDREKRVREEKTRYKDDNYFRDLSCGDKSDPKNFREENQSFDHQSRMPSIHDNSPGYDDRARLKDAQGRKRTSDKDDYNDMKSRGFKDRRYDSEKRSTNDAGVDLATDRARSGSKYADLVATSVRSKNQGSPCSGSHATRDQYRLSKEDEFKYRDYAYEERVRHSGGSVALIDKISSSRSIEKVILREDGLTGELSADRLVKTDIRNSPRQLVDKSPSSTSVDRRYLGRSDFRRSDVDVGLKELKNYSTREGRGTRDLVSETRPGDKPSQGDADAISVSSPFNRNSSISHPHPHPHPHPPRSGEDDGRLKLNHRYNRRNGDPNMVRASPWKGLPNWAASPVPNGFVPFHHGPPIGFHHAMQQFPPAPPILGLRPNMDLNHPRVPFSIPDPDRFSLHGHHLGWRPPYPPPLHVWESNDATESRLSGRHDWQHNRTLHGGGRPWEPVGDSWKSLKIIQSTTHTFVKDEGNQSNQSSEHVKIELSNRSAECFGTNDTVDTEIPVSSYDVFEEEETLDLPKSKTSEKDDAPFYLGYLSELDISVELTDPGLYSQFRDILNMDDKITPDSMDDQVLYIEQQVSETKEKSSLFVSIDDSLLQKAITLYKRRNNSYREKKSTEDKTEVKEQLDLDMVAFNPIQNLDKPAVTDNVETTEDKSLNAMEHEGDSADSMGRQEQRAFASSVSMETGESSSGSSCGRDEINIVPPPPTGEDKKEEENLVVTKNGSMVMSNVSVSSKAYEVDVLSGSVNSNRIHYSPESTH